MMLILGDPIYAEKNAGPFRALLFSMADVCKNAVIQIRDEIRSKKDDKSLSSQLDDISVIANENNLYAAAFNAKGVYEGESDSRVAHVNKFGVRYKIPGKKNKIREVKHVGQF